MNADCAELVNVLRSLKIIQVCIWVQKSFICKKNRFSDRINAAGECMVVIVARINVLVEIKQFLDA